MTKRLGIAFALGLLTPLVFALYLGGERIAVAGIKLAAIENGFHLAAREWTFDAVPAHEGREMAVAQAEELPAKKAKARR